MCPKCHNTQSKIVKFGFFPEASGDSPRMHKMIPVPSVPQTTAMRTTSEFLLYYNKLFQNKKASIHLAYSLDLVALAPRLKKVTRAIIKNS